MNSKHDVSKNVRWRVGLNPHTPIFVPLWANDRQRIRRANELAPYIAGKNNAVQTGAVIIVTLEYLLHPLALLLLYLAIEGLFRFMAGLVWGEGGPYFFVGFCFTTGNILHP